MELTKNHTIGNNRNSETTKRKDMEINDLNDLHQTANDIHPILGKFLLFTTFLSLVVAHFTLQNIAYIVSIAGGTLTTFYYAWRWRREYKEYKKQQNENK